jgi:hypothetical protein
VTNNSIEDVQRAICRRFDADYCASLKDEKVGIAENVRTGLSPINGLRHTPTGEMTGWYIWAGVELSDSPDFFVPLHVEHLDEWCPEVKKYLGLAPGWRFLIADEYEDVWFDESLLRV